MRRITLLLAGLISACSPSRQLPPLVATTEVVIAPDEEAFPDLISIEVLPSHRQEVLERLRGAGFQPQVGLSHDGNPMIVLRGLSDRDAFRAASLVPPHYYARRGYGVAGRRIRTSWCEPWGGF